MFEVPNMKLLLLLGEKMKLLLLLLFPRGVSSVGSAILFFFAESGSESEIKEQN